MTPDLHYFYLARLTLETLTPLSIGMGAGDGVFDVLLVRDANGLPTIPGSSLAGVLRHLYRLTHDDETGDKTRVLFGYQDKEQGEPSRLHVSSGVLLDGKGQPVEGLLLGEEAKRLETDILLKVARATADTTIFRDRVRITHRGAAGDTGKFDRSVLPAGYRFGVELSLWSAEANDPRWKEVLGLPAHPLFRLGGGTRAGLGKLKVVNDIHSACFDLKTADGRKAFSRLSPSIANFSDMSLVNLVSSQSARFITAKLTLEPHNFWRIGQGDLPHLEDGNGKPADLLPKIEQRVKWNQANQGEPALAELLVPAASVKGALAHSVAFHANRLTGRWAEEEDNLANYDKSEHCEAVRNLFGFARNDRNGQPIASEEKQLKGQAGRVYIDDAYVAYDPGRQDLQFMMHNAIDRFTGGVREHFLFSEELVWRKTIEISLLIDTHELQEQSRLALRFALNDLCQGRLSLGGGAGKGHGFFDGGIEWSDQGRWINGNTPEAA